MKLLEKKYFEPFVNELYWISNRAFSTFLLLLTVFISTPNGSVAQTYFGFEYDATLPVKIGTTPLKNPWSGGFNYAQFSDIDIDFDGDLDLVLFDRSGDEFLVFEQRPVNGNPDYVFLYNGAALFPSDCKYRATFLDYNQDGKNDLFTYGIGGIKVYKNTGNSSIGLQWELAKAVVETDYLGNHTNLYVSSSDIPAYADVEGDGDIDVLTFQIGGERMEYHQNQSIELYGIPDSLIFELKNECWGQFREDPNNNDVVLNDTQSPCGTGNIPNPQMGQNPAVDKKTPATTAAKHSGSTILALDINNNGVLDLVLGDVAYSNLTLLINGGTAPNTNSAMVSQDHNFPSNTTPASSQLFPAPYYVDVNFDGVKDLLVTPNARTVSQNQKSAQYFKNTGTNTLPNFIYQQEDFLQDNLIDHGLGSIPVMFDQNGDGKRDLLVGNFFRYKPTLGKESCFLVYRNTGTGSAPEFTYYDDDYLGLTQLSYGLRSHPAFGDLDGDGDEDLIIGKENGSLIRYTNTAGAGNPCVFANPTLVNDQNGTEINVTAYAAPQLFDLNNDGLLDLIIGKKTGEIAYYANTGTTATAQFTLQNDHVGNADVSTTPDGYATPHFFRVHDTTHLFLGGYDGQLHYYNNIDGRLQIDSSFHLVNDYYLGIDVGLYSAFWVEDVDNDGLLDLFAGQDLGGLFHFEANPNSTIGIAESNSLPHFYLSPNPATNTISLHALNNQTAGISSIQISSVLGALQTVRLEENESISIEQLASGTYFLHITSEYGVETLKFIKL